MGLSNGMHSLTIGYLFYYDLMIMIAIFYTGPSDLKIVVAKTNRHPHDRLAFHESFGPPLGN